jgi:transporter family protein
MKNTPGWVFAALASAFFAGLTAILGKAAVAEIDPDMATMLRTVVIFLLTAGIVAYRGAWSRPSALSGRGALFIVLSGVATGLSWLFYYRALRLGPASRVAPIDKLSVVFAMILAAVFLGETISWRAAAGGALVAAGAILIATGG